MKRLTFLVPAALAIALIAQPAALARTGAARAETVRTIYFSATDAKGAVVNDLAAADITVKEGGKDYPVTSLQPAKAPMHVSILVDDGGSGAFQAAVAQFLQKTFGRGKFAISVFMPKPSRIVDFTADFEPLKGGLAQIGARPRVKPDGDQLPEAIQESARTMQQMKAERPVIPASWPPGPDCHRRDAAGPISADVRASRRCEDVRSARPGDVPQGRIAVGADADTRSMTERGLGGVDTA